MFKTLRDVLKLFPHCHRVQPGILGTLAVIVGLSTSATTTPVDKVSSQVAPTATSATQNQPDEATKVRVLETYGKLPLSFEANQGQVDQQVNFLARGSGYSVFLTPTEAVLTLRATRTQPSTLNHQPGAEPESVAKADTSVLRLQLVNSNPTAQVKGLEQLSSKSNYLTGNNPNQWHTDISHYAKVQYQGVYAGIDLVYYGNQRQLEYDFIVAPGANPKNIKFHITGAQRLEIDKQGNLLLHTQSGVIRQHRPVIYQEINGKRREIAGSYVLLGQQEVGFTVATYDPSVPLVIDPVVSYSTYLGGSSADRGTAIAVDSAGNVYVIGNTNSNDFPTKNAFDSTVSGIDVFVTKLKPTASGSASLVYSTYLGGSDIDAGYGIAVDKFGNAYMAGYTKSSNFPTQNAFDNTKSTADAFVTKLNATGDSILYSTYLGGNHSALNYAYGIAVDSAGNAYVTGGTNAPDFPIKNGFDSTQNQGDAFVTKLNPTASGSASLVYSTFLGGATSSDFGKAIAVDSKGYAYVTGYTNSTDFPTKNAFSSKRTGPFSDAFVTKLNPAASGSTSLVYSTYLGGSHQEYGNGIAVDSKGNAYVTGQTQSTDFPTKNLYKASGGHIDPFVTKVNATGNTLLYSTYLGGKNTDYANAIALDSKGYVYVTGPTESTDFPIKNAFDGTLASSSYDAFVMKLNPAASGAPSLVNSSYLGGRGHDFGNGIAVDSKGNIYVTGETRSTDFPKKNAYDSTYGSFNDAFVTKIAP